MNTYCALGTVLVTKEAAEDIAWRYILIRATVRRMNKEIVPSIRKNLVL